MMPYAMLGMTKVMEVVFQLGPDTTVSLGLFDVSPAVAVMLGCCVLALIYALSGPYLPGVLAHRGYGPTRLVEHLYLSTEGIWGIPLGVSADFVFLFVLFGSVLGIYPFAADAVTVVRVGISVGLVAAGFALTRAIDRLS